MPESWWWLSFVDDNRPVGDRFVGGCWVQGYTLRAVIYESHVNGLNPGGEVQASQCPDGFEVPDKWANRLLDRDDIKRMNRDLPSFR